MPLEGIWSDPESICSLTLGNAMGCSTKAFFYHLANCVPVCTSVLRHFSIIQHCVPCCLMLSIPQATASLSVRKAVF